MTRIVGVDLGVKSKSVSVVLNGSREVIKSLRFALSVEELERVEREALEGSEDGTRLLVVMEKTFPTCMMVSRYFLSGGHQVSYAKPDQVKQFRKALYPKAKTDEKDAYVMARLPDLDPKQLERCHEPSAELVVLKTLLSHRLSMVNELVQLKNQTLRLIDLTWPGLMTVLSDLDTNYARSLVRKLNPEAVSGLGEAELAGFLENNGPIKAKTLQWLPAKLLSVSRQATALLKLVDGAQIELQRARVLELLEQIERLELLIARQKTQLEKAYSEVPEGTHLESIPGIGRVTAATMLTYFGEPHRFASLRKAQGFAGLYPVVDASGLLDRKATTPSKAGPAILKRDLFLVADTFRKMDPQGARLYYEQMVHKGKHHKSALCVLANRMLIPRILRIIREQRPYEFRDFDGNTIDKKKARELAAQYQISEDVRRRLRNRKAAEPQNREPSPLVTSKLEASRYDDASRPRDPNKGLDERTTDQVAMLIFRTMEDMLSRGGNIEEIRLALRRGAADFFEKRP